MIVSFHRAGRDEISARDLHDILRLRGEIFVVEQGCAFAEIDGRDMAEGTDHLWFRDSVGVVAASRVLVEADGSRQIGRVVTRPDARGRGLGARLMVSATASLTGRSVTVRGQSHLEGWYARFGYDAGTDPVRWNEDGIPHVAMHRPPGPQRVTTTRVPTGDPVLAELVAEVIDDLTGRYPEMEADPPAELVAEGGTFVITAVDDVAAGCGAVRRLPDGRAELKRMYVRPEMRGRGVVQALLAALEEEAVAAFGVDEVFLVTGHRQPEALAAYRREGFVETEPWGRWVDIPLAVCMRRPVRGSDRLAAIGDG